ncbi:MAG TPA: acetylxylan esterase [Verrucomicrobiota bacterium]|nr:acetylxylan esterase [Verrucomicrobiota bacterium]HNU49630.1 acetylxylan esterase [Verrucomicrobiota bacterium]
MEWIRPGLAALSAIQSVSAFAATAPVPPPTPADRALAAYFAAETAVIERGCLAEVGAEVGTAAEWEAVQSGRRSQLREMLGLLPWPERGDLRVTVTGQLEHDEFRVEKLHFQSLPGLYVTGNLYVPKAVSGKLPGVLYLCGHSRVVADGVSCGNKTGYQHHGAWFAQNGYVCLIIDTVQLGEIEGLHHGTYREGLWWWNSRGYTPAGVEAWNGMRALDLLASRPEVDPERLGVTGRSGGGAYSWFVAALDDRVKVAAPVAGITDLENHVVDGTVEGHCDCMFFVNTYRWDYPLLAALVAPRPLLLCNSDKDTIFPLDGVLRVHDKVRRVYSILGAAGRLGLLITEGPHEDTQDLQVPVLRWFNRWLKAEKSVVRTAAEKYFEPRDLRVFDVLPADAINTTVHERFVPVAKPMPQGLDPALQKEWRAAQADLVRSQCFGGWPLEAGPLDLKAVRTAERDGTRLRLWDFISQPGVDLRLYALSPLEAAPSNRVRLRIVGPEAWQASLAGLTGGYPAELAEERAALGAQVTPADAAAWAVLAQAVAGGAETRLWFAPRGIGLTAWSGDAAKARQIRRRFMLLGQTLDGMRVWDIRRAMAAAIELFPGAPLTLEAEGGMAVNAVYASLFASGLERLEVRGLPAGHREGPDYLNVLRIWDLPDAIEAARDRCAVVVE